MKRKGFTLVELLAVIALIAIIGAITMTLMGDTVKESQDETLHMSVEANYRAIEYFVAENPMGDFTKKQNLQELNVKNKLFGTWIYKSESGVTMNDVQDNEEKVNSTFYIAEVNETNIVDKSYSVEYPSQTN